MNRLFDEGRSTSTDTASFEQTLPLAARMRPRTVAELVGQQHLLWPGSALAAALEHGRAHSMILYGPPGSGKTTIARILAHTADAAFSETSAVSASSAEVREVIAGARERLEATGRRTIFFLDEIHRFNKQQQDALLPAVEDGIVILIGATTQNPYFEVNSALLSRCQIYELNALGFEDVLALLRRALSDERGIANAPPVKDDALEFLASRCAGDARRALSALELACRGEGPVTVDMVADALQRKAVTYDRQSDHHYDTASAWIKATRGSDPDASLLYLATMLEGGEDPRFIARRMVIFASEDIGNADPNALGVAVATAQAVEHVGMPECAHNLAQAAIYLALAPKSNASTRALAAARSYVQNHGPLPPPAYLRSGPQVERTKEGYDYPHDNPDAMTDQQLMPDEAVGTRFVELSERGTEELLSKRLAELRRRSGG